MCGGAIVLGRRQWFLAHFCQIQCKKFQAATVLFREKTAAFCNFLRHQSHSFECPQVSVSGVAESLLKACRLHRSEKSRKTFKQEGGGTLHRACEEATVTSSGVHQGNVIWERYTRPELLRAAYQRRWEEFQGI